MQSECVPVAKSMFSARGAKALIKQPNEGTKERRNERTNANANGGDAEGGRRDGDGDETTLHVT